MKSKCRLADAGRFNRQLPEHLRLKLLFCFISVAVLCTCAIAQENTAESWYKKGIELENNGSYVEAIKAYEQSIELNQSYAPAWSAKGALLFRMGKKDDAELAFEKAIDLYNETLEKNPQDTIAWIDRGVAFTYLDRQEESIESRQKALEIFNQTVEKNSSDPQALSDKAFTLAGMGRYSESIEALDRVIELTSNPTLVMDAWRGKAVAYAEGLSEFNKSLEAWDKALELMPANDTANLSVTWGCKAKTFDMAGRFEEANAAYQKVIELSPGDVNAWIGKGFALKSLGRSAEAEAAFDKAINSSSDSKYWLAWFGKGEALLAQEKYDEAVIAYDEVIELNPTHATTWNEKGTALQALGRQAEAEEVYANAQKLGYSIEPETPHVPPVVVNVTSLGDDDSIELANNESLPREFNNLTMIVDGDENNSIALPNFTMQPGQKIRIHFGQGESNQTDLYLWSKIDLDDAAGNLTLKDSISGIERGYMEYWTPPIQENTTGYWIKKAIELRYRGSFEESAQAYDQALQLDPENATLWIGKALDLSTIGRDNDSIKAYETALQLTEEALKNDPQNAMAWHRKGKILSNLGREDEASSAHETALATSDQILEKDAENSSVLRIKAEALASLGQWDESLQALDKVIEINPSNYDAMGRKSEILVMMGMFNESLQALNQAIELIPANDTLELLVYWSAKSEALQSANRLDEAITALDKVIELDPQNAAAWRIKGFIFKEYPAACCGDGPETVLRKVAYSACND
jgi:tetratricopeptide (TPR) repeat protein